MELNPISPWSDHAECQSPDGRFTAVFQHGMEMAMGAPTMGELWIKSDGGVDRMIADNAAASFVWSDDARFLAFSRWRRDRNQSLCVLRLADMAIEVLPGQYRVLELRHFGGGIIKGVDSPVYQPHPFSIPYDPASALRAKKKVR